MHAILQRHKRKAYRILYEFTKNACGDCALTDCACKDTICAHVENQARKLGVELRATGHRLRFIGCGGCVVPPHLRETCTIFLCDRARNSAGFDRERYGRLLNLCARIEERMMAAEVTGPQSAAISNS